MLRSAPLLFAITCGSLLFLGCSAATLAEEDKAQKIKLMTSLPLVWGDGGSMNAILSGDSEPAAIYAHWKKRYDIEPVDSLEGLDASGTDIVFLIQPRAMAPADLADLDKWIRGGGAAIILADPDLVWPSDLPFGDSRRPLASSLLSPLLSHWGLELATEDGSDGRAVEMEFQEFSLPTFGVGAFRSIEKSGSERVSCQFGPANFIARCSVGMGKVIMVADADFLHQSLWGDDPLWREEGYGAAMRLIDQMVKELGENRDGK